MAKTGVLLLGFGGPDSLDAVEPFMRNLMGREPSEELLTRVRARYLAIGGKSPLLDIAIGVAEGVDRSLRELQLEMPIQIGMAYWSPYIDNAVEGLVEKGCDRIITVSLSAFESNVAQQAYRDAVDAAIAKHPGVTVEEAPLLSELDEYADYYASAVATALSDLEPNEGAILVYTAHSLPESDLTQDDPYIEGLRKITNDVSTQLGLEEGKDDAGHPMFREFRAFGTSKRPRAWYLVYQSKGNKPGAWLGPDLDDFIDACADSKVPAIVCVPIGFAMEHMETLYDLDIVAADRALSNDIEFIRVPTPSDHDVMTEAIARAIAAMQ